MAWAIHSRKYLWRLGIRDWRLSQSLIPSPISFFMQSNFEKIEDFQRAAGSERPSTPTPPAPDILALRQQLIREEYEEVTEAITAVVAEESTENLAALAHELADLLYVVYGTFSACGIDADAVFTEVHRANMEKIGGPRRADGKLLKPPGWQPADVTAVLAVQGASKK